MSDGPCPVLWRRTKRAKRLSLRLDPARRQVVVTYPHTVSLKRAEAFLDAHRDWVKDRLADLPPAFLLQPGASLPFSGRSVTLIHAPDQRQPARLEDTCLTIGGDRERFEQRALCFLRKRAGLDLPGELLALADYMDCKPSAIACGNARTRWGSCTRSGRIMLNWRLILMPEPVKRYVMIHELAHMTHFDHSRAFWAHVDRFHPDRLAAQAWLKAHGSTLLALN
ncbi:M48 family metallopeptidase [Asaia krungthepensis]|uniref:Metal-dependent hydrolase n=1 Tax=Asaia krungthepensis NRIC 0535 TaxID=1307925 RepID=A0ABQ0Q6Z1_9PROT|nr:SprT family zinc-dependent metalloprotease [Asaia krungthepensis]GBQ94134.1 putative metal-dependent hydrolase [Asaia krungthepensis NRIC 0535]